MLYGRAWPKLAEQWDAMQINTNRITEFNRIAKYAFTNRQQYLIIEENTGVPWAMIACIHKRESDAQDHAGNPLFTSYLGNGQPLSKRTTIEPIGRGPFESFEEGAIDALDYDHLSRVIEQGADAWRLEKQLFYMWALNGFGHPDLPSPYLWGGTNIQKPGKYTSDHHWDPDFVDPQPGCAPMLWSIMKLDPSIECKRED
jgi:lysozyme family protein